jgi:hypothetical protein
MKRARLSVMLLLYAILYCKQMTATAFAALRHTESQSWRKYTLMGRVITIIMPRNIPYCGRQACMSRSARRSISLVTNSRGTSPASRVHVCSSCRASYLALTLLVTVIIPHTLLQMLTVYSANACIQGAVRLTHKNSPVRATLSGLQKLMSGSYTIAPRKRLEITSTRTENQSQDSGTGDPTNEFPGRE